MVPCFLLNFLWAKVRFSSIQPTNSSMNGFCVEEPCRIAWLLQNKLISLHKNVKESWCLPCACCDRIRNYSCFIFAPFTELLPDEKLPTDYSLPDPDEILMLFTLNYESEDLISRGDLCKRPFDSLLLSILEPYSLIKNRSDLFFSLTIANSVRYLCASLYWHRIFIFDGIIPLYLLIGIDERV